MKNTNKTAEFFNYLVAHYWTRQDFDEIKKKIGIEAFEEIDWRKEAAWRFIWENTRECQDIYNHRILKKIK